MPAAPTPLAVTAASLQALGVPAILDVAREAETLGYDSFWTAEVNGLEAMGLLGAVATQTSSVGLATGVVPVQVRTPPLLAMAGATLQALAPEREVVLGIGISSPVVAAQWHGAAYGDRPLAQMREYVALLRACLSGDRVDFHGDFYDVARFRLQVPLPDRRPQIVVAALNEGMLRLAGEVADGVLLNYLPATHEPLSVEHVRLGGSATVYAYVHVGVGDREAALHAARRDLFSYAVVDAYARSFVAAGYGEEVAEIRARFAGGDRDGAVAAVSERMVDGIDVVGDADHVRATVEAYVDAGVERPVVMPLPWGPDRLGTVRDTLRAAIGS